MRAPSGLHIGVLSVLSAVVNARETPVAVSRIQRCFCESFFSTLYSWTLYTRRVPSRDRSRAAGRFTARRSSAVIARLGVVGSAATTWAARRMNAASWKHGRDDFMLRP